MDVDAEVALAALDELIRFPSVGGTASELAIQDRLAGRLSDLGLEVDLWPLDLPELRRAAGYPGEEVDRGTAYGLVATNQRSTRGSQPVEVILQGHVDVVPPGDLSRWHSDPYAPTIRGSHVVGRGACDMKGGVAAILGALDALSDRLRDLPDFAVHFVVGEEDGGLGAFATLQRGYTGAACVIPEPTGLQLVTANAGSLTFRIEIPGRATHGSTAYAGSSAIDSYLSVHQALAELQRRRNREPESLLAPYPVAYPLSVGRLQAGDWPSSVPDRLVAEGRYGLRITEDPDAARAELESAVLSAAGRDPFLAQHPPVVSWPGGQFRGGHLPEGNPLAERLLDAHAEATGGRPITVQGAPWGSDLRLYAAAGIPTVHYGPGDVRLAHGPDEAVPVTDLLTTAEVLLRVLQPPAAR